MTYTTTNVLGEKPTVSGKKYKTIDVRDNETSQAWTNGKIWGDHPDYNSVAVGSTITGVIKEDAKYGWSISKTPYRGNTRSYPQSTPTSQNQGSQGVNTRQTNQFIDRKAEHIKEAQERKDLSIAFFNSTNCAITFVEKLLTEKTLPPFANEEDILKKVFSIRDKFYAAFTKFQASSIEEKTVPFSNSPVIE